MLLNKKITPLIGIFTMAVKGYHGDADEDEQDADSSCPLLST